MDSKQTYLKKVITDLVKKHIEPVLIENRFDYDIRIYNDNEDGVKVDFVEYWSDINLKNGTECIDSVDDAITGDVSDFTGEPDSASSCDEEDDGVPFMTHELDWSPFEYGFTIDSKFHKGVFDAIGGMLPKGTSKYCTILIGDEKFDVKFDCPNVASRTDTIVRMLYINRKHFLGHFLRSIFPDAYLYIKKEKNLLGGRHQVTLPAHLQAELKFYKTDSPLVFRLKY